jgi:hypothetical protein
MCAFQQMYVWSAVYGYQPVAKEPLASVEFRQLWGGVHMVERTAVEQAVLDDLRWDGDPVTCAQGLTLLTRFVLSVMPAYQLAVKADIAGLASPMNTANKQWSAYEEHCSTCQLCRDL